ncbi:MAG: hypothetical protein CMF59_17280 [Leptospiraceae bacterium]|nr:hypothetical protein [Leptospiraceae bacterium]
MADSSVSSDVHGMLERSMNMNAADNASGLPCHGSNRAGEARETGSEDSSKSHESASCCNNETVNDAPAQPAMARPILLFERLPAPITISYQTTQVQNVASVEVSRPPDSVRLHVQNQQFLN